MIHTDSLRDAAPSITGVSLPDTATCAGPECIV